MKDRKKLVIIIIAAILIIAAGVFAGVMIGRDTVKPQDASTTTTTTTTKNKEENLIKTENFDTTRKIIYYDHLSVITLNNYGVVYDDLGTRIIDEKTEKVIKNFPNDYEPRAFDGNTLYLEKKVLDKSVKVNPEVMYGPDGEYFDGWDNYYVSDLLKYNIADDKLETVIRTNCEMNDVVYFDESCLYYSDIPENQIGYYGDYDSYGGNCILVRYDYENKTSNVVCEWDKMCDYNIIFTDNDAKIIIDLYPLQIYSIKNEKMYTVEEDAKFACIKENKIIYSVLDYEAGKLINEMTYEYEYPITIKQCNFDGSEIEVLKTLVTNENESIENGDYPDRLIYCGSKKTYSDITDLTYIVSRDSYSFYDTETGEMISIPNDSGEWFVFNDKWFSCKESQQDNIKYIEKINLDGSFDSVCDVPIEFSVEKDSKNISKNGFYYLDYTNTETEEGEWKFVKQELKLN